MTLPFENDLTCLRLQNSKDIFGMLYTPLLYDRKIQKFWLCLKLHIQYHHSQKNVDIVPSQTIKLRNIKWNGVSMKYCQFFRLLLSMWFYIHLALLTHLVIIVTPINRCVWKSITCPNHFKRPALNLSFYLCHLHILTFVIVYILYRRIHLTIHISPIIILLLSLHCLSTYLQPPSVADLGIRIVDKILT